MITVMPNSLSQRRYVEVLNVASCQLYIMPVPRITNVDVAIAVAA